MSDWSNTTLTCLAVVVSSAALLLGSGMSPRVVEEKEFSIIGIEVRTNNAQEKTDKGAIGKQWGRFYQEGLLQKIPGKVDSTIYSVYTDYQSDRNGDYTYVIGAKVSNTSAVPAGMVAKKVPAQKYAVITVANGPVQTVIAQAWQEIWSLDDKGQLGGKRAYKADFEAYDTSQDPQNSHVDIYVGIK